MVANQQDVQEVANLAAVLTRQVEKLLDIVDSLALRITALERKVRDASG